MNATPYTTRFIRVIPDVTNFPIFREEMRNFSVGDRIQFTAPANQLKVANRELGTIESIEEDGRLRLKMDGGRTVELDPRKHRHLDHGYAMTTRSSQGQTADRVLIHVDTELGTKDLLNSRMAYVSVSRGRYDAQIYTNNAATLGKELSRDVSHSPAIQQEPVAHKVEPQPAHSNECQIFLQHPSGSSLFQSEHSRRSKLI
jgi:ATP-dependent exoDNAse (exonuclease V) alpha subunit